MELSLLGKLKHLGSQVLLFVLFCTGLFLCALVFFLHVYDGFPPAPEALVEPPMLLLLT